MGLVRTCKIPKKKPTCYFNRKGTKVCRPACKKYTTHKR